MRLEILDSRERLVKKAILWYVLRYLSIEGHVFDLHVWHLMEVQQLLFTS